MECGLQCFVTDLYNAAAYIGALWYHPGMIGNGSFFEWLGGAKYLSWGLVI